MQDPQLNQEGKMENQYTERTQAYPYEGGIYDGIEDLERNEPPHTENSKLVAAVEE
jgi:hypothetical protein